LIECPRAVISSIAGTPASVAGTLTSRFGRAIASWKCVACVIVASVSSARVGSTVDRDVAVAGLRSLPDGPEQIAGSRDVAESEAEEDALRVAFGCGDLFVVGVPLRERLLEDARVGGDADDTVFINGARESAGFDQVAREVIDPDALAERRQLM
jgi:hypothetical protein